MRSFITIIVAFVFVAGGLAVRLSQTESRLIKAAAGISIGIGMIIIGVTIYDLLNRKHDGN